MTGAQKQKDVVCNAIRALRSRRVRPSCEKIAWYLRTKHLIEEETSKVILNELVKSGEVQKVEYKGGTSYRLTTERPPRSKYDGLGLRLSILTSISLNVNGMTIDEIASYLSSINVEHTLDRIGVILQREIRSGSLIKQQINVDGKVVPTFFSPGNLLKIQKATSAPASPCDNRSAASGQITPGSEDSNSRETPFEQLHLYLDKLKEEKQNRKKDKGEQNDVKSANKLREENSKEMEYQLLLEEPPVVDPATLTRRGRPVKPPPNYEDLSTYGSKKPKGSSQRLKRPKKAYENSEPNSKKRLSSVSCEGFQPITTHRCDVCLQGATNGSEDLLICHYCSAKAHPSCLGYNTELAVKSRNGPWTCMDCKHCTICNMDHNIGTLIFCDKCDRAYHLTCHNPPLDEQPQGSWICFICDPNASTDGYEFLPGLPTPSSSPTLDEESIGSNSSSENPNYDPQIPNAANWSVNEVVQYFKDKGFEKYCNAFKEQDIDGTALLMLTRLDVLTGLNMKLGPALKIYKQVRILQTRCANPPMP